MSEQDRALEKIIIKQAAIHNLKDVNLSLPYDKLVCFTGISGSGKSSLVYDLLFTESQRRYFATYSGFARQFLNKLHPAEAKQLKGLLPAIAIKQRKPNFGNRSTVGTLSELYDLLRLLFARLGSSKDPSIKLSRSLFSFNTPQGACPHCKGLGVEDHIAPDLLIADPNLSLRQGALKITTPSGYTIYSQVTIEVMEQVCQSEGFSVDIPWKDLTEEQKNIVLNGSNKIKIPYGKHSLESRMKWTGIKAQPREEGYYKGILPVMEHILKIDRNPNILKFARTYTCSACEGSRLNSKARNVYIGNYTITQLANLSIFELMKIFKTLTFMSASQQQKAEPILAALQARCRQLNELGLGYLTLSRSSHSLSGGEVQRILLCTQLGNQLGGMLYLLDEPAMGLHARDKHKIMQLMQKLQAQGNTVWMVEHDKAMLQSADLLVELGPKAGKYGGEICWQGSPDWCRRHAASLPQSPTLELLTDSFTPYLPTPPKTSEWIEIKHLNHNNLKNLQLKLLAGGLNVICGVSGAGKTTLLNELAEKIIMDNTASPFAEVMNLNANPIGRTPRSNPATYTKVYDKIRKLFAAQPLSKKKGYKASHFSFNTKGGRCENCQGAGVIQTGMHFMGVLETLCETCNGQRFNSEILKVTYKGKNIAEVLAMEIREAIVFFRDEKQLYKQLSVFAQVGLDYLTLGQSATTLSGGEAQRLKLATFLMKQTHASTLFLFDEPATGLHSYDVKILLTALEGLLKKGHTAVIAEHQRDFIEAAHHIIELGPEGGENGGNIIFQGTPKQLKEADNTPTSQYLWLPMPVPGNASKTFPSHISLKGVTTHNLKSIDIHIPHRQLTVITGVSGSGKSSLVFDSLFAEGQHNFTSHFSAYARSMLQQKPRPAIEQAKGLTPPIAISGHAITRSPRATVGTITGIWDALRLLFSRIAESGNELRLSSSYSFNHETGMCPACKGLGSNMEADADTFISHPERSISDGAMQGHKLLKALTQPHGQEMAIAYAMAHTEGWDITKAWKDLPETHKQKILYGTGDEQYAVTWHFKRKNREGIHEFTSTWPGLYDYVNKAYRAKQANGKGKELAALMKEVKCKTCNGNRLKKSSLLTKAGSYTVADIMNLEIQQLPEALETLKKEVPTSKKVIVTEITKEIKPKIEGLMEMGLGYLTLLRDSRTLSGGEGRRVRLVSQLGGHLNRITYILDEPTIGLHASDIKGLIKWIKKLAQQNTVVVVEHDTEVMAAADYLIELGPGSGRQGGNITFSGVYKDLKHAPNAITTSYLSGLPNNTLEATPVAKAIKITGACANNLKHLNLQLISNGMCVFSGVSGSGKSSLLHEVIYASAIAGKAINCKDVEGLQNFSSVRLLDQTPLSKSGNSIPLTYLNLYDTVRNAFARQAKAEGSSRKARDFSLFTKGGRCETCKGEGKLKTSMDFLSAVWVPCPSCKGNRFQDDILNITLKKHNIADMLSLNIAQLDELGIFTSLHEPFSLLNQLGLGHLKAGQPLSSLSGGEAQRLKLAKVLLDRQTGPTLFLLDEPTTGLHMKDIEQLLTVFAALIGQGHTLYVIEHHPEIIKRAHQLINLGPLGGEKGGYRM